MAAHSLEVRDEFNVLAGTLDIKTSVRNSLKIGDVSSVRRTSAMAARGAFARAYLGFAAAHALDALCSDLERSDQAEEFWRRLRASYSTDAFLKFSARCGLPAVDPNEDVRETGEDIHGDPVTIRPRSTFWLLARDPEVALALVPSAFEVRCHVYLGGNSGCADIVGEDPGVVEHLLSEGLDRFKANRHVLTQASTQPRDAGEVELTVGMAARTYAVFAASKHAHNLSFEAFVEEVAALGV